MKNEIDNIELYKSLTKMLENYMFYRLTINLTSILYHNGLDFFRFELKDELEKNNS